MFEPNYILVDGSSYLYRAYHALPELKTSTGQDTGAIKGVVSMLKLLQKQYPTSEIAVIFDARGKTFRHDMYPLYKQNRPSMPSSLASQIELLHQIIRAMGLPLISVKGVEADDVIATLVTSIIARDKIIFIASSDKDLMQLVGDTTFIFNASANEIIDKDGVKAKFGVYPQQIRGYLALLGDSSDNIPGIAKVGAKTAAKLLTDYTSLEMLISQAEGIKGKIGENIRSDLTQLNLSYELIKLKTDVDLNTTAADLHLKVANTDALYSLFKQLEFRAWYKPTTEQVNTASYIILSTQEQFDTYINQIVNQGFFALDIVTDHHNYMLAKITAIAIALQADKVVYINLQASHPGFNPWRQLQLLLENNAVAKIGYNLKYILIVLRRYNIKLSGSLSDVMLSSYAWNITATNHQLSSLARFYLDEDIDLTADNAADIPVYLAHKATVILCLNQFFNTQFETHKKPQAILTEIELPVMEALAAVEYQGAFIDTAKLNAQDQRLAQELLVLQEQAYLIVGNEFNLASPKQLQEILYNQLKLPVLQKTPNGQPSTAEEVLQKLAANYELPRILLQHRSLAKLKSAYTHSLPQQVNQTTKRLHTTYNQALTSTGRLSSIAPNLQNIPVRNEEGRKIRQAFIVPKGYKLVAADYSQIELRIMAHLSGELNLINAFKNNIDVHTATAAEVLSIPIVAVTHEQRRRAKAINFGLIYGMSAFGLAKQLNISRVEAQNYINTYFERYPKVLEFMEYIRTTAAEKGYVSTVTARRLYVLNINSTKAMLRKAAQRAAINGPMQGSAADIIKLAMIKVHTWLQDADLDAHIIMQVHDELVLEVLEDNVAEVVANIGTYMAGVVDLSIPLIVDISSGDNWGQLKPIQ